MAKWQKLLDRLEDEINEEQFVVRLEATSPEGKPQFILIGCHPDNEDKAFGWLVVGAKHAVKLFQEKRTHPDESLRGDSMREDNRNKEEDEE